MHPPNQVPPGHPADQLVGLTSRTIWVLYGAFWLSVVVYAAILAALTWSAVVPIEGQARHSLQLDQELGLMQGAFLLVGVLCLYLARRLGRGLLQPERLWEGTPDLHALAARLQMRRGTASPESADALRASLGQAVQHLLGRIVVAHLIPWVLVEVPAVLGLMDCFLSGGRMFGALMIVLAAVGLALRRPDRGRLREILAPIYRMPVAPPWGERA